MLATKARRAAIALVATLAVGGGLSASVAVAQPAVVEAAPGALVELDGTQNTRTLAGFATADGKVVRDGRVLRSDNLSTLSPGDVEALQAAGVVTVVDLRTGWERLVQPDREIPGASSKWFDVFAGLPPTTLIDLPTAYRAFVTDPTAREAFASTLREIAAASDQGKWVLFHCSAGKDRAGWTTAVLLTLLGVDRETVEADFLASNDYRHTSPSDPFNGVNIDWLRSAFRAADEVYGSVDGYVRDGLGLTDDEVAALRVGLLQ
ncbi:MAG TPA: tyrosine-protein phosphatase [Aldersonia sp.]